MTPSSHAELAERFLGAASLRRSPTAAQSLGRGIGAVLLAWLGFEALATTSSGSAATLGLLDGQIGSELALEHAQTIVAATVLPVSADLENGFAPDADGVAETARRAVQVGLAGFSIEDYSGDDEQPDLRDRRSRRTSPGGGRGGPLRVRRDWS